MIHNAYPLPKKSCYFLSCFDDIATVVNDATTVRNDTTTVGNDIAIVVNDTTT